MATPLDDPTALVGRWRAEREIDDRHAGRTLRLDGFLTLAEVDPGHLAWTEELTWRLETGPVAGTRRLDLVREDERWEVRFDDGRAFHPWAPGDEVVHPCAPDTYRGTVTGDRQRWTVVWEVVGPAKDYTMVTTLTPA